MEKNKIIDPYLEREKEKYGDSPIPSRELILSILKDKGVPMNHPTLCGVLQIKIGKKKKKKKEKKGKSKENFQTSPKKALLNRLRAMVRDGQLELIDQDFYWLPDLFTEIKGKVKIKNGKKYLSCHKKLLRLYNSRFAMQNHEVTAKILKLKDRKSKWAEKAYLETIDTSINLTGYVDISKKGKYYLVTKESAFKVWLTDLKNAKVGDRVTVSVCLNNQEGTILEVLEKNSYAGFEIEATIEEYELRKDFSKDVIAEANKIPKINDDVINERTDLRDIPFVTIDGFDSKDFDDAVFCEKRKNGGFKLFVAIADVAHYVEEGSALDLEAQERGNSVYFPNKVLPMLPEELSNGICSLVPNEDRLSVVCEMTVSELGKVTRYKFYDAIINSSARLTYDEVADYLDEKTEFDLDIADNVDNLYFLYEKLIEIRQERGAIDFETVESYIEFDKSRQIVDIKPISRNVAHKIIEECMLCANVSAAKFLIKNKIPGVFRNHIPPSSEKMLDLKRFLDGFDFRLKDYDKPTPKDYNELLSKIREKGEFNFIEIMLLRSLMQAIYSVKNEGHFGLSYQEYTHFTSPIRRYADLIVHRQIKKIVSGEWDKQKNSKTKKSKEDIKKEIESLENIAKHISITERTADDATRAAIKWLKCKYIQKRIGETFRATITGVTHFGFFAELEGVCVDGLVHISSLFDYFHYVPEEHKLVGEHTGETFTIGDKVTVVVEDVLVEERKIDFVLV